LRSGDLAARWLTANTPLRLGRSTSDIIAPSIAAEDGMSVEEVLLAVMKSVSVSSKWGPDAVSGRRMDAEIAVGLRHADEVESSRDEAMIDLFDWFDRAVHVDPTQTFGPELCYIVVTNHRTLDAIHCPAASVGQIRRAPELRRAPRYQELLQVCPTRSIRSAIRAKQGSIPLRLSTRPRSCLLGILF